MKMYNNFDDMVKANVAEQILEEYRKLIANTNQLEDGYDASKDFESDFGGKVCILETVDDLKLINTYLESDNAEACYATLYEKPVTFDQAFYLPGKEWAYLWLATNNSGGPTYFIPKAVVLSAPNNNVEKSIILTNGELLVDSWREIHADN